MTEIELEPGFAMTRDNASAYRIPDVRWTNSLDGEDCLVDDGTNFYERKGEKVELILERMTVKQPYPIQVGEQWFIAMKCEDGAVNFYSLVSER